MYLELLGATSLGIGIGTLVTYWLSTRPLINKIASLRYDGFRPETPVPQRPKTVPIPNINET